MIEERFRKTHVIAKYEVKYTEAGYDKFHELTRKFVRITAYSCFTHFNYLRSEKNCYDTIFECHPTDIEKGIGIVEVAWPPEICGIKEGIPLLLSTALYISVYDFIDNIELYDLELPLSFVKTYRGPRYGTIGLRDNFKLASGPLIGIILKPRICLTPTICKEIAEIACRSGVDYIIDDELMVDPENCPAEGRAFSVMEGIRKGARKSAKTSIYILNVTSRYKHLKKLLKIAERMNVNGVMINPIMMGFDAIQYIREQKSLKQFIVANSVGRGILTYGQFKMSENVLCLLSRIAGADAIYSSTYLGALKSKKEDVRKLSNVLTKEIYSLKPSFAISSGGININNLLPIISLHGNNIMIQMGETLCRLIDEYKDITNYVEAIRILASIYVNADSVKDVNNILLGEYSGNKKIVDALKILKWEG